MLSATAILSYVLVFFLLAALAWRDAREYILPNHLNAALALAFMAFHIALRWSLVTPQEAMAGALAGGGLLLAVRSLAMRFYHEDSLGLGDVKLMAAAGLGLGYPGVFMALTFGAALGVIHGLCMAYLPKHKTSLHQVNVPAGVGLALGIAAAMYFQFGFEWLILLKK